jgi:hypothetical protein
MDKEGEVCVHQLGKTFCCPSGYRFAYIRWFDSHYRPGWDRGEVVSKQTICCSIGWVVAETDELIIIAGHVTDEDEPQRCGEMTIPKSAIESTQWL